MGNQPYDTNNRDIETKNNVCVDGCMVRSKGESLWYNTLYSFGIPFRYECKVVLSDEYGSDVTVYPDFLIRCCEDSYIIIEHSGMLLEEAYADNFKRKIKLYLRNGYVLGDNLIYFSDNQYGGINTKSIDNIVKNIIIPKVYGLPTL